MADENNTNGTNGTELYPLDDAAIEAIADLDKQESNCNIARNAILSYFLRQHKLSGDWRLAPNRRELVKLPAPVAQMQQP